MSGDLAVRLQWLGFVPLVDFVAVDDGSGPRIAQWLSASQQPSDAAIAAATPPAPTGAEVDAERDRRIALPLPVALSGNRSFAVNMDDNALRNMNGLATAAVLAKVLGSTATTGFITYGNDEVQLSPDDLISLGLQVQTRISAVTFKGRDLKNLSPIPADLADDSYWP